MNSETVHGYEIRALYCFSNDRGFALAHNPMAALPHVCWQFTENGGAREYYWGRYSENLSSAISSFNMRVSEYKRDNPTLTEKYNYLADAEMDIEQNYNMVDGCINNEKPSILKQLNQVESPEEVRHGRKPQDLER